MLKRPIPGTREMIPAIGLGTYNVFDIGQSKTARDPLKEVLRLFAEAGGMVDSSPMYGSAERVVGNLAGELGVRGSLFLATKVWTTGKEAGIRQMEDSLRLLRTDKIDLMQVHNLMDWQTHFETLRSWKEQGRIRYTGITHYATSAFGAMERVMKAAHPDFIQIYYSIVTRQAEERLLPLAADLGIGVIVNRPFETADLFGRVRGKRLPAWAQELDCSSWAQFFLKFILSHPAVTCAIPATGNAAHLLDNRMAGHGPLPDGRMREKMAQYLDTI
jgi:aryl-alcohol dehydrogenase-like predicted oxidoreductase